MEIQLLFFKTFEATFFAPKKYSKLVSILIKKRFWISKGPKSSIQGSAMGLSPLTKNLDILKKHTSILKA